LVWNLVEYFVHHQYLREEANAQFKRDWMVEQEIVALLRERLQDCYFYEKGTGLAHLQIAPKAIIDTRAGSQHVCKPISDTYDRLVCGSHISIIHLSNFSYKRCFDASEPFLCKNKDWK
jgi:hypothetical protein